MNLAAGFRLGPYEIVALLGVGGMGEVYRARDARLGRDVALKVLPPTLADDPERRARLAREARVLAALNHPHIASVYGFEESDGTRAIVLELVDGATLADRIAFGPLAVDEAVAVARQIASAVEAAHDKGIVHRDLKPANIKLTPDGTVKVLDFGLAKATGEPDTDAASPTVTALRTHAGLVVGTAAYMSPEQARGQAVDVQTDIWAFGCVLYEMLTGRAAFARSTTTDTLAAVVDQTPAWSALPSITPPAVQRLLRRCLEKDTRQRLHAIADARLELDDAVNPPLAERTSGPPPGRAPRLVVAVAVGVAAVATAIAGWSVTRNMDGEAPSPVRFALDLRPDEQLALEPGLARPMVLSRDGRTIFYVTRRTSGNRIYARRLQDMNARSITGTEGGQAPFLSPDEQWLGFAAGGFLRKVPIAGGAPQNIAPTVDVVGASWSDDGVIVFNTWSSGLFKVPADGGTPQPLTTLDERSGEVAHIVPHALPGTSHVVFAVNRRTRPSTLEIADIATGRRQPLLEGSDPHYLSTGHLVFTRGGSLHAAPFDLARLALTGPAVGAAPDITVAVLPMRGAFAADRTGTIAYVPADTGTSRLVWVDLSGNAQPVIGDELRFNHPRLSPDGTGVLVSINADSGGNELWIFDVARNTRLRLSAGSQVSRPIWSHDGETITFQKEGSLYSMPADDSGAAEVLLARDASASALFPLAWSRDGRTLVYSRPAPGTNRDVFTLSVGAAPAPFLATTRDERSAMLSPDGRWMVYAALDTGREEEVFVQPYPGPGQRAVISEGGGREPVWSPSGSEIFYRSIDGLRMISVPIETRPVLKVGRPRTLFQGRFRPGAFWSNYDVSPDGRRFLMLETDEPFESRLHVALNWLDLRARNRNGRQ